MSAYRPVQPPEVSCYGKEKMTPDIARQVAAKLRRNGSASAYHCEHCNGWHVGSHVKKRALRKGKG